MKENIPARLDALRAEMKKSGIDAAIIPQADAHISEYLASYWQARRWLSGFTGSAGDLLSQPTKLSFGLTRATSCRLPRNSKAPASN